MVEMFEDNKYPLTHPSLGCLSRFLCTLTVMRICVLSIPLLIPTLGGKSEAGQPRLFSSTHDPFY